jgi:hypothetical protein
MPDRIPISRDDLIHVVGELDDLVAAELVATGATVEELIEAVRELEREAELGEVTAPPSTPRVAALRALLERPLARERWPDEDERPG